MKILNIDAEKCSGCRLCELACAFSKEKRIIPKGVWSSFSIRAGIAPDNEIDNFIEVT